MHAFTVYALRCPRATRDTMSDEESDFNQEEEEEVGKGKVRACSGAVEMDAPPRERHAG